MDEPELERTHPEEQQKQPNNKFHWVQALEQHWHEFREKTPVHDKLNAFFTLIVMVATVTYVIVASRQLGVMNDTLNLERPWIGPVSRTLVFDNSDPAKGHLKALGWHYRNGGRTVATRMRFNLEFKIGPLEPTESTAPVSESCRKGELAGKEGNIAIPGDFDNYTPITVPPEIEKSMDDIYQGKTGLYVVGCIDYSDAARKSWYRTEVLELFLPKNPNFWVPGFGNNAR
jgi:hypothetical protein